MKIWTLGLFLAALIVPAGNASDSLLAFNGGIGVDPVSGISAGSPPASWRTTRTRTEAKLRTRGRAWNPTSTSNATPTSTPPLRPAVAAAKVGGGDRVVDAVG